MSTFEARKARPQDFFRRISKAGEGNATEGLSPPGNIFNFNSGNESPDRARQFGIVFVVVDIRVKPHTLPLLSAQGWSASGSYSSTVEKNHDFRSNFGSLRDSASV